MSVMLFKLRGVEDDEADDIRALLESHDIDFYETTNGRWGLGFAAIWLHDETQLEQGKVLIRTYQVQRYKDAQATYAELCVQGEQPTVWKKVKQNPVQVFLVLLAVLIVAIFALSPFVML
ncbi:DUF6164 family protein [Ghiorsea bivora]|uniref:DUF6164 family protein n=1 Tax=Ghiorsea bivora TaxID=1485545 RepID=UPI0005717F17|nr:DUF6164 family protein [Ghiorsea bivora]